MSASYNETRMLLKRADYFASKYRNILSLLLTVIYWCKVSKKFTNFKPITAHKNTSCFLVKIHSVNILKYKFYFKNFPFPKISARQDV
jgi:hypothetical protein